MGSAQSYVTASLSVSGVCLLYVHIYCSYKVLKTNVLDNDRLPSFVYLYIKFVSKAVTRRTGDVYTAGRDVVYSVLNCR